MGATTELKLKTTGMHCQSCAMLVDMTVGDLEGIAEVSTDYASGDTMVKFDPDQVSVDEIIAVIRSAGYDAGE